MHAAGSTNSADWTAKVNELANAPGEQIFPGELANFRAARARHDREAGGAHAIVSGHARLFAHDLQRDALLILLVRALREVDVAHAT